MLSDNIRVCHKARTCDQCLRLIQFGQWARQRPDVLRRIWPVIDDVCGEHALHVHIVDGLMQLEVQLAGGQSLSLPRWRRRIVDVGMDALLEAAHKAQAFRGKGGGKAFAEGMLQAINHGLRNKLAVIGGESEPQ